MDKKKLLDDIDYSFYEKIFELEVLASTNSREKDDLNRLLVSLKKNPTKILPGYPAIKIKTQGSLDPKYIQFYCYESGKSYWKRFESDRAAKYVLNFAEKNGLYIFYRTKVDNLIKTLLYREAVELQFPGENVRSGEIWVNFQDKHLVVDEWDYSWRLEEGNPNYFFRHALQGNFEGNFEDLFFGIRGKKPPIFWDGKKVLDNPLFLWFYDVSGRDLTYLEYLQKMLGVWITSSQGISGKFYLIVGPPQTGKSSFIKIIEYLIGIHNCCHLGLKDLSDERKTEALEYSQLNTVADLGNMSVSTAYGALTMLKLTTGGDSFTVSPKYVQPYSIICSAKHIFGANELPRFLYPNTKGWAADAFWDRVEGLPFYTPLNKFRNIPSSQKRDPDYIKNLIEDNIIWCYKFALDGLFKFLSSEGFKNKPPVVTKFMGEYKNFMEKAEKVPASSIQLYFTSFQTDSYFRHDRRQADIYINYLSWCKENNEEFPESRDNFFKEGSEAWKYIYLIEIRHKKNWYGLKAKYDS